MRSLLSWLGLAPGAPAEPDSPQTETVRKIVQELDRLPREQARYLASFAYVLSRVAHADLDISSEETRAMEEIVRRFGHLSAEQAVLVVQIAKSQTVLFGGTESFQVTRELKTLATREQCLQLLDCLFAVSAADDSISAVEETQVRQIAEELGLTHRDYVEVRAGWSEKRSVMRRLGQEN